MVTVAKSLDVPIKLMFPRPAPTEDPAAAASHAMLGLGDVVLPGIMIGLALRFDLYLFYLRRQKRAPGASTITEDVTEKPKYYSFAGRWSDHFWSHSLTGRPLWTASEVDESTSEKPFTFPKTYFKASLIGYVLGLLATLGVMMVWNHAQPALLYLVPGVLGSLWLTALVRGEMSLMWSYTEDVEDETNKEKKAEAENDSKLSDKAAKTLQGKDELGADGTSAKHESEESGTDNEQAKKSERVSSRKSEREILSFTIEAPRRIKKTRSVKQNDGETKGDKPSQVAEKKHNWVPSTTGYQAETTQPPEKRVRLK